MSFKGLERHDLLLHRLCSALLLLHVAQTVKLCSEESVTKLAFAHNAVVVLQIPADSVSKDRLKQPTQIQA
jgi:hypothetical protein